MALYNVSLKAVPAPENIDNDIENNDIPLSIMIDKETQTDIYLMIESDLAMNSQPIPTDQRLLTYSFAPEFFPSEGLALLTASDGGRRKVFGNHRHSYAGAFALDSAFNFTTIMLGPQNITLAEIVGCCQTLLRTRHISAFDNDHPHVHVSDSMNCVFFMTSLQTAVLCGQEMTNHHYNTMLCIEDYRTEFFIVIDLLRTKKNLRFKWVESHTDNTSLYHRINSVADRLCSQALESYYGVLPPVAEVEEELLKFNNLPEAIRDLY